MTAAPHRLSPNIILISVDTLRADHLGAYGYDRQTTPFLDSLAARGLLFEHVVVPIPATSPSHASLLTSVSPWKHLVANNAFPIASGVDTLAAALRRSGYETAGAVAVTHIGRRYEFDRGFDRFTEPAMTLKDDNRRPAEAINADVRAFIDGHIARRSGKPLFVFAHYFDCHYPYRWWDRNEDQSKAWDAAEQGDRERQIRRYDDGVRRVDAAIADIYRYAHAKLGNDVIFCVTADHGEQIGDHGVAVGHADIYRETDKVPLILSGPGIPVRRVAQRVTNLDIGITLANIVGAHFRTAVEGRDLLEIAKRSSAIAARWWTDSTARKFIVAGIPTYSRSLLLVDGPHYFIRNFDYVYRTAWIETPAARPAEGWRNTAVDASGSDGVVYTVPFSQYEPFRISIEHRAKVADCAMTAVVSIAPSVRYFTNSLPFKGSIRITVPGARLDSISVTVSPARCAGTTVYHAFRFDDALSMPSGKPVTTDLFNGLVARKASASDELYDSTADPAMRHNLVADSVAGVMRRDLADRYKQVASGRVVRYNVPAEEQRRLRSLGYLH